MNTSKQSFEDATVTIIVMDATDIITTSKYTEDGGIVLPTIPFPED